MMSDGGAQNRWCACRRMANGRCLHIEPSWKVTAVRIIRRGGIVGGWIGRSLGMTENGIDGCVKVWSLKTIACEASHGGVLSSEAFCVNLEVEG